MQLILVSIALALLFWSGKLKAQIAPGQFGSLKNDSLQRDSLRRPIALYVQPDWKKVDVDFLSSYYEQDGDNAAVTGGLGSEQLTDFTQKIVLNVPLKPQTSLHADIGYDYYTSASSDMIDPIYSDESGEDVRTHGNIGLDFKMDKSQTIGFHLGGSTEFDYQSLSGGLNYSRSFREQNTAISLQYQTFQDNWSLIYPRELRGQGQLIADSKRQTHNGAFSIQHILGRRTQVSLQLEATYMRGLLSTPFHRVYFQEQSAARIERLPNSRLKLPVGIRLNHYLSNWLVLRLYYRYYWDDWGIQAHTAQVEMPVKLNRFLSIAPYYRFHSQTAADYFAPYKAHSLTEAYYTSDYDLSGLRSHTLGAALNYQPAGGIFNVKLPLPKGGNIQMENVDLKYARYIRSTGLRGNIVSFGMGFGIQ